ncbi:MAG: SgcJ/EcaC family oxidoreductase, partial [Planctomycetes bacterium]|nr:SgcJ/EcaC family oxidoreductase [Planctomycetota bacterium]
MTYRSILLVALIVLVSPAMAAPPADRHATARHAGDEAAIRQAVASYVAAFNRGDAEAVARHWSDQGVYTNSSGQQFQGREAIEKEFTGYFSESTGQIVEVGHPTIRFMAPNVAVEEGRARVSRRGEPPAETGYVAIHVKQAGTWKLDSVRETVAPPEPSHYGRLKGLEWMIGRWVDRDEDSTVETVCQWTKNKNFITRSFTVSIKDRIDIEGTQVIGWDPAAGAVRSWMFDSEGGFGEARWSREGNRWVIKASRTLKDGEKASAVNILTYV